MASCQQILHWTEHESKRRAELMTDVAEKSGLGTIDLSQSLHALFLFFGGASILDRGGDLPGNESIKGVIFRVEPARGVYASDQNSSALVLSTSSQRQNDGFRNTLLSQSHRQPFELPDGNHLRLTSRQHVGNGPEVGMAAVFAIRQIDRVWGERAYLAGPAA